MLPECRAAAVQQAIEHHVRSPSSQVKLVLWRRGPCLWWSGPSRLDCRRVWPDPVLGLRAGQAGAGTGRAAAGGCAAGGGRPRGPRCVPRRQGDTPCPAPPDARLLPLGCPTAASGTMRRPHLPGEERGRSTFADQDASQHLPGNCITTCARPCWQRGRWASAMCVSPSDVIHLISGQPPGSHCSSLCCAAWNLGFQIVWSQSVPSDPRRRRA